MHTDSLTESRPERSDPLDPWKSPRTLSSPCGLALAALLLVGSFAGLSFLKQADSRPLDADSSAPAEPVPFEREMLHLLDGLDYSGIPALEREEVFVEVDFAQRKWTLRNLHRFTEDGGLILEQDARTGPILYGTCGELAAHLLPPVRRLFGDHAKVEPVTAAQSGFFLAPQASHVVLWITLGPATDGRRTRDLVLDPSFRKYGPLESFDDYLFFERLDALPFVKEKQRDVTLAVRCYVPLLIRQEHLLSLGVEDMSDQFDGRNFVLALGLTRKHRYSGRYLYALRMQDGKVDTTENRPAGVRLLGEEAYLRLRARVSVLFEKILQQ
ncbi:MAG: hypothetical protein HY721_26490 [Planctomycetes bacterium]|nr:hypothetical protein [Planctomycetota bacterium]